MGSRPRFPLLIWRSITGELLRILLITSASVLAVIAFAGAVKPLADGRIGLGDALALALLLGVPMMQFALPFAAGFASTLSYHRMASDNEAVAAAAGGVGHRSLLAPALGVGLALGVTLTVLANDAIPAFLRGAERLVHRALTRLLVAPIKRGLPIRLGEFDVYANDVIGPVPAPGGSGALESVVLRGVLAVQPRAGGGEISYYGAERVDVLLFEDPDDPDATAVQFVLTGASTNSPEGAGRQRRFSTNRIRLPSRIEDDPKFLGFDELRRLRLEPRRMRAVDQRARRLAASLAEDDMIEAIRLGLRTRGQAVLEGRDRRLFVDADRLERTDDGWRIVPGREGARITITLRTPDGIERSQRASGADLRLAGRARGDDAVLASDDSMRTVELRLRNVLTVDPGGRGIGVERAELTYSGLATLGVDPALWKSAPTGELLAAARERVDAGSELTDVIDRDARNLRERVKELRREITSKFHERLAYAAACLVMVVTGAVVALRLRDSLPLPVYLWSFFPALLAVITISSGQRMTHRHGDIGLLVLWGGVAALAAFTVVEFGRLRRH